MFAHGSESSRGSPRNLGVAATLNLTEELELAFRTEGDTRTIHGFAHSIARVLELDHLRIAEQLAFAGVDISAVARASS